MKIISSFLFFLIVIIIIPQEASSQKFTKVGEDAMKQMTKYYNEGLIDSAIAIADSYINDPDLINDAQFWFYRGTINKDMYKKYEKGNVKSVYREKAAQSFQKSLELEKDTTMIRGIKKQLNYIAATYYNDAVKLLHIGDKASINTSVYSFDKYLDIMQLMSEDFNAKQKEIAFRNELGVVYGRIYENDKSTNEFYELAKNCYTKVLSLDSTQRTAKVNLLVLETRFKTQQEQLLKQEAEKKDKEIYSLNAVKELAEAKLIQEKLEKKAKEGELIKQQFENLKQEGKINQLNHQKELANIEKQKKEAELKLSSEKIKNQQTEIMQKNAISVSIAVGLLLLMVFSVFIFNRWRVTQKQKRIIEVQKVEVENQRELADSRRVIAEEQKLIIEKAKKEIEEKNKNITDSIHYASRIQRALFTSEEYIGEHLKDFFIFFKPRDIVSGDFYWAYAEVRSKESGIESNTNSPNSEPHTPYFYLACCDCTGHGVPGAFMSLLNISFLNEAVIEKQIREPDKIFNDVRSEILKALNPDGKIGTHDGMDAVLCAFDLKNNLLHAACANNHILIINNGKVKKITSDKMPVGSHLFIEPFTKHSVQLQKGDVIYLFSDGYADQFGGAKIKKFMYKQFEETLLAIHHLSMQEQKNTIEKKFDDWKGDLPQVDDVLVIGIKV